MSTQTVGNCNNNMNDIIHILILLSFVFISCINSRFIYEASPQSATESIGITDVLFDLSENRDLLEFSPSAQSDKRYFKTQQYHQGIPIFAATLLIEKDQDHNRRAIFGNWYHEQDIIQCVPNINATLNEADALQIAFNELNITAGDVHGNVSADLQIYFDDDTVCYLTYIIKFIYKDIRHRHDVFKPLIIIEALHQHNILKLYNDPYNLMEACGDGGNAKMGAHEYCVNRAGLPINDVSNPKLKNADLKVYDNQNYEWWEDVTVPVITCSKTSSTQCTVDEGTVNGAYGVAADIYAYALNTWDMYYEWEHMNEAPILSPKPFPIYVHVGTDWGNANFAGDEINFGDGDTNWHPLGTLSIAAHELAHGYTDRVSGLVYSGESGGMNEAYSDIVGECAEWYLTKSGTVNWENGNDIFKTGGALRYLFNPPLDGISIDHYCNFQSVLDVHYSSGLYNKAAYLLSVDSTYAWSMEQIFKVFSTANKYYWTSTSTFNQGVCGLSSALNLLYTGNTAMETALINSFAAVGLECGGSTYCATNGDFGVACGLNTYCFYRDVPVSSTQQSTFSMDIKGYANDGSRTAFFIYLTITNYKCINPKLTLKVERIDYDGYPSLDEMLEVYDNDGAMIKRCTAADVACGVFDNCLSTRSLNNGQTISKNTQYLIKLKGGYDVGALCGGAINVNAILKFRCDQAPTPSPTPLPTALPTTSPTDQPTSDPTTDPTNDPTANPTNDPTADPTHDPTNHPTRNPTWHPTWHPSIDPTADPTNDPTADPTTFPTNVPTRDPSKDPTSDPTLEPTFMPTSIPTLEPSANPTGYPTFDPTNDPTSHPTFDPTTYPTTYPTFNPTAEPTIEPTTNPTNDPTVEPTFDPTFNPTVEPTVGPTTNPTNDPTVEPTVDPSTYPTNGPTSDPSTYPTHEPTIEPTYDPTADPTVDPTSSPTNNPTSDPTIDPTYDPTVDPTSYPTSDPSIYPTVDPTVHPTEDPTTEPTHDPTFNPNTPTFDPTAHPTFDPTIGPTENPLSTLSLAPSVNMLEEYADSPTINSVVEDDIDEEKAIVTHYGSLETLIIAAVVAVCICGCCCFIAVAYLGFRRQVHNSLKKKQCASTNINISKSKVHENASKSPVVVTLYNREEGNNNNNNNTALAYYN